MGAALVDAAEPEELPTLDMPDLGSLAWDGELSLRTWAGYNDNPQLSSLNAAGSAFVAGGGDLLLYRLPIDGWEATFFGLVEHVAFLNEDIQPETIGVVDARVKRIWESGWSAGVGLDYIFLRQVFDASELEGVPLIVRAEGHALTLRPVVERRFGSKWRGELEWEVGRQWLAAPLDSFWDLSPRLSAVRTIGPEAEAGASYRFRGRFFDTRSPRDADGMPLSGSLRFTQHEMELFWRQAWDDDRRWRTTLRGGFVRSVDNGEGFYDYERFHLAALLRYTAPQWEVRGEARLRWYLYPVQSVDGNARRRSDVTFSVRGEWKVRPGLRLFGDYAFESSDENERAADYRVQSISAGIALEM
jgi:hypothetical protein